MKKLASFWQSLEGKKVRCNLCARRCVIATGKLGACRARKNENGALYSLVYGSLISMAVDPIEKKPLYHFWPGSGVLSIASPGCNFSCLHCQNWSISQTDVTKVRGEDVSPEELVKATKRSGARGIAHTYTEPIIWTEYAIEVGKLAHREELYNTYVTNGYITPEALGELAPYLDAANVDVKAFTDDFYRRLCGVASIRPTLDTCEWLAEHKIHLEVTYLIIPEENDSEKEIKAFCRWVVEKLGPDTPVHFSRFYPHHKLTDRWATPTQTLERAVGIAKEAGARFVYIGNVPGHEFDNTYCPTCGKLLIERYGFSIGHYEVKGGKCPECDEKIPIVGEYTPGSSWLLF
jgi:pyruvate formate lyase activating enzyme